MSRKKHRCTRLRPNAKIWHITWVNERQRNREESDFGPPSPTSRETASIKNENTAGPVGHTINMIVQSKTESDKTEILAEMFLKKGFKAP